MKMDNRNKKYWRDLIKNNVDETLLNDILISVESDSEFKDILNVQKLSVELKGFKSFDKEKAWSKINEARVKEVRNSKFVFLRYVAAAVIILLVGLTVLFKNDVTEFSSHDNDYHIVLNDGSDVILSPNSKLSLSNGFNEKTRTVILEGNAYFNVEKDKSKPFVIQLNKGQVKVLGTKFYVDQSAEKLKVDLYSGKVALKLGNGEVLKLNSKETAIVNDVVVVREIKEINNVFDDLFLDNVKIKDAILLINKIYNKEIIELDDSSIELGEKPIHTTIKNSSVREFINGLKLVFNVKVINSKGKFIISTLKMK